MPYLGDNEKQRLQRVYLPGDYDVCVERVRDYMARADLSAADLAERVGKGRSTVNAFIQQRYTNHGNLREWRFLAAHLIEFIERNPVDVPLALKGNLFQTENYRRIARYFNAAVEHGEVCLLYGPPGTQKSFVLGHLVAERNRTGKYDALLIYTSQGITPLCLLKRIGRAAGVLTGWVARDRITDNLLFNFSKRGHVAIIVDEAQHLGVDALETLRELHDRSACGMVLAGSHNLFEMFMRGRAHLEQWLSRIDHKEPLPGLLQNEVCEIAARELGNGHPAHLSEKRIAALLDACRVDDIFARGPDGKPCPRKYYSARRLVKVLDQVKLRRAS
jgi:DNA transposition AAA+ family ATPase